VGEEALAIGLYAALVAPSFEAAIRIAANHSGDSDSTASIAGQLYGVWKGLDGLPHRWARSVDVLDPLLELIARLLGPRDQPPTGDRTRHVGGSARRPRVPTTHRTR
jgi:ADP-ribosyl-[dinitrogen reductase] hydrolase